MPSSTFIAEPEVIGWVASVMDPCYPRGHPSRTYCPVDIAGPMLTHEKVSQNGDVATGGVATSPLLTGRVAGNFTFFDDDDRRRPPLSPPSHHRGQRRPWNMSPVREWTSLAGDNGCWTVMTSEAIDVDAARVVNPVGGFVYAAKVEACAHAAIQEWGCAQCPRLQAHRGSRPRAIL